MAALTTAGLMAPQLLLPPPELEHPMQTQAAGEQ
jgi:hypothetical protein